MTSKSLYSKLIREDLKRRLWAAALISLGCFFFFPVAAAFMAGEIQDYVTYKKGLEAYAGHMMQWLSFGNGFMAFCILAASLICGLSSFSYLNSRNKVDFYHSIPVRREKLYVVNFLNGILILAVPYMVCALAAAVIAVSNDVDGAKLWPVVFDGIGLNLIYFVLNYTVVVIASMLTGHLVIALLGSGVFAFLVPIITGILSGYYNCFFVTYVDHDEMLLNRLLHVSPVTEYIIRIGSYYENEPVWGAALAALLAACVLAAAGCFLYRKRPSEAAGKAMAFGVSRVIIRIPIVITSALGLGIFFWEMRRSLSWAVFGLVCGAVISHCVIEIIYHFDFKKLFAHKLQLLGCILVSMAVLFVFRFDLTGYDRYLPSAGDVKEAAIVMTPLHNWTSYGNVVEQENGSYGWKWKNQYDYVYEHMHYEDVDNLMYLAAAGAEQTDKLRKIWLEPMQRHADEEEEDVLQEQEVLDFDTPEPNLQMQYTIRYTLSSGRHVYRVYQAVPLKDIQPQVEKMYQNESYLKGVYPLMNETVEDVGTIRYKEKNESVALRQMTAAEKKELLDTYRSELSALTIEQMKKECPIGLIRFTRVEDEKAMDWDQRRWKSGYWTFDSGDFGSYDYYPVYPSFTGTIRLLKQHGVEPGSSMEELDIQSLKLMYYLEERRETVSVIITAPEELEELKPLMVIGRRGYYNDICQMDDISGEIALMDESDSVIEQVNFVRGTVPEFVKERLREAAK